MASQVTWKDHQTDPAERGVVLMFGEERLPGYLLINSRKYGIASFTITHLESDTGRPTLWMLLKIAGGLGMNLSAFVRSAERETQ